MTVDEQSIGRAAALRDAATRRIRSATVATIALATGLTAAFTAVAASSTHPRQHVLLRSTQTRPTRQPLVVAPAPALVPVAGGDGAAPTPTPTPTPSPAPSAAPAPAPAPVAVPPVVSSGGS
jgi:hypothetical protein